MIRLSIPILAILLGACGDGRPPAPTAEEAARLDDTEAMLNSAGRTQEGPATRAPGPSD